MISTWIGKSFSFSISEVYLGLDFAYRCMSCTLSRHRRQPATFGFRHLIIFIMQYIENHRLLQERSATKFVLLIQILSLISTLFLESALPKTLHRKLITKNKLFNFYSVFFNLHSFLAVHFSRKHFLKTAL